MSRNRLLRHRAGTAFSTAATTGAFTSAPLPTATFTGDFSLSTPGFVGSRLHPATITGAGGTNSTDTDWGAVGDGSTDDTVALQNALNWLGGATHRILNFGTSKTYIVNKSSGACLSLTSKTFMQINGNGSTIKQKNGMTVYFGAFGLDLITCSDVVISNLTFDGNRANRTPAEQEGHPCALHDCDRVSFVNCTFKNSAGSDCLMLSGIATNETDPNKFCTSILVQNCTCDNGYRGGLFVRNVYNCQVLNGTYSNANGTPPKFGIAIEPNAGSGGGSDACRDILIIGAHFTGNKGVNAYSSQTVPVRRVSVLGCRFDGGGTEDSGNNAAGFSWGGGAFDGRVAFNTFENITTVMLSIINIQGGFVTGDASGLVVENNSFNTQDTANSIIRVHPASGTGNIIRNNNGFALLDTFVNNAGTATVTNNNTTGSRTDPSPSVPPWSV